MDWYFKKSYITRNLDLSVSTNSKALCRVETFVGALLAGLVDAFPVSQALVNALSWVLVPVNVEKAFTTLSFGSSFTCRTYKQNLFLFE